MSFAGVVVGRCGDEFSIGPPSEDSLTNIAAIIVRWVDWLRHDGTLGTAAVTLPSGDDNVIVAIDGIGVAHEPPI